MCAHSSFNAMQIQGRSSLSQETSGNRVRHALQQARLHTGTLQSTVLNSDCYKYDGRTGNNVQHTLIQDNTYECTFEEGTLGFQFPTHSLADRTNWVGSPFLGSCSNWFRGVVGSLEVLTANLCFGYICVSVYSTTKINSSFLASVPAPSLGASYTSTSVKATIAFTSAWTPDTPQSFSCNSNHYNCHFKI